MRTRIGDDFRLFPASPGQWHGDLRGGAIISCTSWMVEAYGPLGQRHQAELVSRVLMPPVRDRDDLLPEMWNPFGEQGGPGDTPRGLHHLVLVHAVFAVDDD